MSGRHYRVSATGSAELNKYWYFCTHVTLFLNFGPCHDRVTPLMPAKTNCRIISGEARAGIIQRNESPLSPACPDDRFIGISASRWGELAHSSARGVAPDGPKRSFSIFHWNHGYVWMQRQLPKLLYVIVLYRKFIVKYQVGKVFFY